MAFVPSTMRFDTWTRLPLTLATPPHGDVGVHDDGDPMPSAPKRSTLSTRSSTLSGLVRGMAAITLVSLPADSVTTVPFGYCTARYGMFEQYAWAVCP